MKTADEIYKEMLEVFSGKTNYAISESSDLAVRMYATAAQIEALYVQADFVKKQCFPQTADGEYLDYHAQMRDMKRNAATCATGTIRFTMNAASAEIVTINEGTVCMSGDGKAFETTEAGTIPVGSLYADVSARAVESGADGNVPVNAITNMSVAPMFISACSNPKAFAGGADIEGDSSLRSRILDSFRHLPNGANEAYYRSEAMNYDEVVAATVIGRARGVGTVDIYVATKGGLPSAELLSKIQSEMNEKREIAVNLQVKAPTEKYMDVTIEITVASGKQAAEVKSGVEKAITEYFDGTLLGKPVYLAELGNLIYGVDGVDNYHITAPTGDKAGAATELPRLGTLTINEVV